MSLFYKGKHIAPSEKRYIGGAIPLLLGLFVCMICLVGTTWAWFTINVQTPTQVVQSAEYSVSVQVSIDGNEIQPDARGDYMISYATSLAGNQAYSVTITPTGTAQNGYCILAMKGQFYYTNNIPEDGLTFTYQTGISDQTITTATEYDTVLANWTGDLLIAWYWGNPHTQDVSTYAMNNITLLSDGDTVGTPLATRPTEKAPLELNLTNLTADVSAGDIATNTGLNITLTADEGYTLPESVSVAGVETYTYENGVIAILADQIKDGTAISITAEAVKVVTETTATDSNATEPGEGTTDTESDSATGSTGTGGNTSEPSEETTEPSTEPTTTPTEESTSPSDDSTSADDTVSSVDTTIPSEETTNKPVASSSNADESNGDDTQTSDQAEPDNSSSDE